LSQSSPTFLTSVFIVTVSQLKQARLLIFPLCKINRRSPPSFMLKHFYLHGPDFSGPSPFRSSIPVALSTLLIPRSLFFQLCLVPLFLPKNGQTLTDRLPRSFFPRYLLLFPPSFRGLLRPEVLVAKHPDFPSLLPQNGRVCGSDRAPSFLSVRSGRHHPNLQCDPGIVSAVCPEKRPPTLFFFLFSNAHRPCISMHDAFFFSFL